MRDSRRAIVGASVIVRDRTERKRAEEAMREVQEAFRRAFEDAPIGMALFGVEAERARAAAAGQPLDVARSPATRARELLSMTPGRRSRTRYDPEPSCRSPSSC